jgi:hypothetical protein
VRYVIELEVPDEGGSPLTMTTVPAESGAFYVFLVTETY